MDSSLLEVTCEQDCSSTQNYINAKGLTIQISDKCIVNQCDLLITKGNKYGLIGRNGHGKSTIIKAIISGQIKSNVQPFLCVSALAQPLIDYLNLNRSLLWHCVHEVLFPPTV